MDSPRSYSPTGMGELLVADYYRYLENLKEERLLQKQLRQISPPLGSARY
jgi:hypothetical protein